MNMRHIDPSHVAREGCQIASANPQVRRMRRINSASEIRLMRRATDFLQLIGLYARALRDSKGCDASMRRGEVES